MSDVTPDQAAAMAQAQQALDEAMLDAGELVTSITGIFDPTPTSDAVGAGISLYRGDFLGAALSAVSIVPYLGDAVAKPAKIGRLLPRLEKNVSNLMEMLPKLEKAGGKAAELAKTIKAKLAEYAGKFCDLPGARKLCAMLGKAKAQADEAAEGAGKQADQAKEAAGKQGAEAADSGGAGSGASSGGHGGGGGGNSGRGGEPDRPHYSGHDKPWTEGATPSSVYTHIDPRSRKAVQNAIYDDKGKVIGHVDFKNHGPDAPSGHGHAFPQPGNPASGHGPGKPHIPNNQLPPGWDALPPGVNPKVPKGQ